MKMMSYRKSNAAEGSEKQYYSGIALMSIKIKVKPTQTIIYFKLTHSDLCIKRQPVL